MNATALAALNTKMATPGAKAGGEREIMFYDDVTVAQFCSLYIEDTDKVRIFNCESQETVFEGTYRDAQASRWAREVIMSFGIEDGINCINI